MVLNYSRSLAEDFAGEYQVGSVAARSPSALTVKQGHFYLLVKVGLLHEDTFGCHKREISYEHLVCRGQGG